MEPERHYQLFRKGKAVGEITEMLGNLPEGRWYVWCYVNDAQAVFETKWEAERYLKLQASFPYQEKEEGA
jgi:hypothetical protein